MFATAKINPNERHHSDFKMPLTAASVTLLLPAQNV